MTLKHLLAGTIGIFMFAAAYGGKYYYHHPDTKLSVSDSTGIEDSSKQVAAPVNDPKQEFKALLAGASLPLGLSVSELNPEMILFLEDYSKKFGRKMDQIKDWGRPYFAIMDDILDEKGLPKELKYLAVIESYLKTNARSGAGAVGPWQLMPATARTMGLKISKKYDERRDFKKSTYAACKYLTNLYELYGDWLLAIAAYNSGPGKVNAAIKKSGSRDFWTLQRYLPAESKSHVKKFIATHYLIEGQGSITTITKEQAKDLIPKINLADTIDLDTQSISGRYIAAVMVKHLEIDLALFNKMNPGFDRQVASSGTYELRLPCDKMGVFLSKKPEILNESLQTLLSQTVKAN